ncbi:MAG: oligosaccharide flippase family protein [Candidatus Desulfofervidaceae bacterium]|nr:oligosaccharide flippase family protein [Candidatus Desulfofervidaceae bacterium]
MEETVLKNRTLSQVAKKFFGSSFLKANLVVFVITNIGNVLSYFFQFVMSRLLTPHDYGTMNALLSLAFIISAPFAVIPTVMANFVARYAVQDKIKHIAYITKRGFKLMGGVGITVFVIGTLLASPISDYLKIEGLVPIFIIIGQTAVGFLSPVLIGTLQGLRRFIPFSLSLSSFSSMRFFLGLLLVGALGLGLNGALLAGLLACAFPLLLGFVFLKDVFFLKINPVSSDVSSVFKEMLTYAIPVAFTWISITCLCNIDMVMVKHYFTAEEAGIYSVAVIMGRIAFYLSGAILFVLFPTVSAEHAAGKDSTRTLYMSLLFTCLVSGGIALVFSLFPDFSIKILFGQKYLPARNLLRIIVISMMFLSFINVLANYCLARKSYFFLIPMLLGVVLEPLVVHLAHVSLERVAFSVMILMITIFISVVFSERLNRKYCKVSRK